MPSPVLNRRVVLAFSERAPKVFTSAASGDWNAPATWTAGSDYPRLPGDTVTIAQAHDVTIPVGVSIRVGAISTAAGTASSGAGLTTLIVNGTLTLHGTCALASNSGISLGAGAALHLNGQNVTTAGATRYTFAGTSGSHCTVTGGTGRFIGGAWSIIPTIDYTDFSGLGDSTLGRTHTAASGFVHVEHCTFVDCAYVGLEDTGTGTNCGFSIRHNDFRNPSQADPETAADYQPFVYETGAIGSQERVFEGNTFETSGSVNGVMWLRAPGMTSTDNVISNWKVHSLSTVNGVGSFQDSFFNNTKNTEEEFFKSSGSGNVYSALLRNYFYYTLGGHPFGVTPGSQGFDATYNVFELEGDGRTCNWFLWSTLSATVNIKSNIFIGKTGNGGGIPMTFTGNGAPTLLDFSANTVYIDNQNASGSGLKFPVMLLTEQASTLTGTVNLYNNLLVDPDTSTANDVGVDLLNNTSDQIDLLDYNGWYGYPGGAADAANRYTANVVVTAGIGANDVAADPEFLDKDRDIAKWDTSLGGPGTAAHAIAEMLKRNGYGGTFDTDYTPANLVTYVQQGFVPQATDFDGVGLDAADIGVRMAA